MNITFDHRVLWSPDGLQRADCSVLIEAARALRLGAASGANASLLRGKQIALMCDCKRADGRLRSIDFDAAGALLCGASHALGATVTRLQHQGDSAGRSPELAEIARLMGRMYDAIDCDGLAPDAAGDIERAAGVPVFNGLSSPHHLAGMAARRMALEDAVALPPRHLDAAWPQAATSNQHYIVQAILLATLC